MFTLHCRILVSLENQAVILQMGNVRMQQWGQAKPATLQLGNDDCPPSYNHFFNWHFDSSSNPLHFLSEKLLLHPITQMICNNLNLWRNVLMNWFLCEHFNQEWQGCILLNNELLLYRIFWYFNTFYSKEWTLSIDNEKYSCKKPSLWTRTIFLSGQVRIWCCSFDMGPGHVAQKDEKQRQ